MTNTNPVSAKKIAEWKVKLAKFPAAKETLRGNLCGMILGREFGEDPAAHIERRGLTEFVAWAEEVLDTPAYRARIARGGL